MIDYPCYFGPEAIYHSKDHVAIQLAHLVVVRKQREKEERLESQYLLQVPTPSDLTSFH
jgi:hypothetical protein